MVICNVRWLCRVLVTLNQVGIARLTSRNAIAGRWCVGAHGVGLGTMPRGGAVCADWRLVYDLHAASLSPGAVVDMVSIVVMFIDLILGLRPLLPVKVGGGA